MGTKWSMPIATIGKPTGDGRQFAAGALVHRDLPLPFRYVHSDAGGHTTAVVVGRIDKIGDEKDGLLPAEGEFYDGEDWPEEVRNSAVAARMFVSEGVIGPSVDLAEHEMRQIPAPQPADNGFAKLKTAKIEHAKETDSDCGCGFANAEAPKMINEVTHGQISSATLVHIPAFAELSGHAILTMETKPTDVAADQGPDVLSAADEDTEAFRQFDKGVGGGVDRDKLSKGDFGDPAGRKFPIVTAGDVSDAAALIGKADDPEAVKARIIAIAKRKGFPIPDSWRSDNVTAGGGPASPPAAWFAKPDLDGPTPLTISDTGRVFGHVASWDTCHIGIGSQCITAPHSKTGYAYFHTGETLTAEGERIAVGRLTFGGGHAQSNMGYRAAAEHYDNSCHAGAVVRAGEDEYGIWVAGALTPGVTDEQVYTMRHTPLSGDWRRVGGNLEMVGALHVNTAGFPIPRATLMVAASGDPVALVAAGALEPGERVASAPLDQDALADAVAARVLAAGAAQRAREREREELVASLEDALWENRAQDFRREQFLAARDALQDVM